MRHLVERYRLLRLLVSFAGSAAIAYVGLALPIKYSAGKETTITLLYDLIADINLHVAISYSVSAFCLFLWRRERNTSAKAIDREHRRVAELERRIDPSRSTSGLED